MDIARELPVKSIKTTSLKVVCEKPIHKYRLQENVFCNAQNQGILKGNNISLPALK